MNQRFTEPDALKTRPASRVRITRRGGDLVVWLEGPSITQREAPQITEVINEALEHAGRRLKRLIFDCSDVRLLTSYGLGMCIDAHNQAKAVGARSFVIGLDEQLDALFKMIKVDRLITIVDDPATLFTA